ncbi:MULTISPECIES: hypothetical protein [unclassified Rhodanobacter]|uniref:hypothetical protein n=1 Tax=unclassified Rhodanobacter TaxID=2621553 RepID=UPI001BE0A88B|nr:MULTISPECIES: hypothetical protein [unclassified Rhodanobacter]MBT2144897.1 hypothetical protein [Rhodanobacter sp. LX-99]MBT2148942.1 hypothetical protein [Rhodanobacter sp. LX-100]
MAALSSTAPTLAFDTDDIRKWGFIWRIGTKPRSARTEGDESNGDEGIGELDSAANADTDQLLEADTNAPTEAAEIAPSPAGLANNGTLTAEEAGLPAEWADIVRQDKKFASAFDKKQGMDFGLTFDRAVGKALSTMLGNIPVAEYKTASTLLPPQPDCVEVGPARVIGGVRPQNFDVAYRPDGVRIAYDSKTLNDQKSIQKNWQNMVNDLGTEATTVHTRFPYAIVGFLIAVPKPALRSSQQLDIIRTLERLATREYVIDQSHLAEAIAFVVWNPETGEIDPEVPAADSPLRYEKFMSKIHRCYVERYKGLPPHDK